MQLYKKALALLFLTLLVTAPLSSTALAQKPVVFVSILPQKYFVEQIAGDTVQVEVMVKPGASPATYEPLPRQMTMLAKADMYLAIGVPFERTWLPRIKATNPDLAVIYIDKTLRKLPMTSNAIEVDTNPRGALLLNFRNSKAEHDAHASAHDQKKQVHNHEGMLDPHIWLSPRWVKAMAKPTRLALTKVAPHHATQYRINTRRFTKRLDALDKDIHAIFKAIPAEQRVFMTFHPSWGYYAMTYNLIQIPIEFEGKAPSPKDLEQITAIAKKRNLRTIFVQPQFSQASAKAIAGSINGSVVTADPLAENWEENLRDVSKKLAASFILCE
ncbi:metal ABC transporter solute-binding protein, Zn/Mn family [Halodesulfovibrio marinisediminis]|uniref:Zinc transport system substrate-binding protein n=1 Tax=Halodesulfovibrio marinisediminis DSM 17456 TaxID=1121457 RepID=A0A1N6DMT0_9BACT|nr:zinc ABC transporter substrate-binding protein [Halodesulfovibrio marinisediminis]SIN71984.1 zinc transport system substrate-binding protein [Halodesulfovibrio marinisediminis DSM 17456]